MPIEAKRQTIAFWSGPWRAELLPAQPYETRFTPETAVIGFAFDGQTGRHAFAGDRIEAFQGNLAEVAAAAGFSSHAHMTALFRRRLGIAPSELLDRGKSP